MQSQTEAKSLRLLSNQSLSIEADSRLIRTARSNYKRSKRASSVQNNSFEMIYIDGHWIQRREIKRKVWNYFTEILSHNLVYLKESPVSMVNRILDNPKLKVTPSQGFVFSQVVSAVQVKIFASDLT